MTPNPLDHFRHHKPDTPELPFRASAWAPARSWPVARANGEPLVFKIRLPVEIELVDVATLARSADGAPPIVAEGAAELERVAGPAGLVVVGALRPCDVPEAQRDVLATLTVAFAEQIKGPPSAADFRVTGPDGESHDHVTKISDKATLITRGRRESLGEGMEPVRISTWEYLLETSFGALVMAFSTTRLDMAYPVPRKLYDSIVETGYIGEEPPPAA